MPQIEATRSIDEPPVWALLQRHLLDVQSEAIDPFLEKYLDEDDGDDPLRPNDSTISVTIPANTELVLDARMDRFDNDPRYELPV